MIPSCCKYFVLADCSFDTVIRFFFDKFRKFLSNPKTGKVYKQGEIMTRAKYAKTLEAIAKKGADEFYTGSIAEKLVEDISAADGIVTLDDLKSYTANVYSAEAFDLINGYTLYSTNATGSGILLGFMLQTLLAFEVDADVGSKFETAVLYYQRITEIFKLAYGFRTRMEDPKRGRMDDLYEHLISLEFADQIIVKIDNDETHEPAYYAPEFSFAKDYGTAHVTVVDQFGNVAAATSSINQ
jgi:gamma-glutamyltranspeptidase 1